MVRTSILAVLAAVIGMTSIGTAEPPRSFPLVVGHRGASGYLPEHTLASYELAIMQGVDYIEPDLVSTKDGVLIARHEVNITDTTDVSQHPEFSARKTTKSIDGISETGWFADDFTLAEIKTLFARQRLAFRPQQFNAIQRVPTLGEVIDLAKRWSRLVDREIGIYPETKHPTYHRSRGLALEEKLVHALDREGLNRRNAPVFIQSFEVGNLRRLNTMTRVRLVQLIDANDVRFDGSIDSDNYGPWDFRVSGDPRTYADLATPAGLAEIATYADGVSPWKRYIIGARAVDANGDGVADDVNHDGAIDDADRVALPASDFIENAHEAGLFVHTWTFRNETRYLASDYGDNPVEEYLRFYCLGIDGLFADFPDTAASSRALLHFNPSVCRVR